MNELTSISLKNIIRLTKANDLQSGIYNMIEFINNFIKPEHAVHCSLIHNKRTNIKIFLYLWTLHVDFKLHS